MRKAIIDNATLTAVQRLLGEIPVKNKHTLDGDILALETLVQTILFHDEIYYIDDYKEEYKNSRAEYFYFMDGISFEKEQYKQLLRYTDDLASDIVPTIKGGEIIDENFKPFFELLKMNNIFTWDMSSSEFYLTQKMLCGNYSEISIEEFSKIAQMIFSEGKDEILRKEKPQKSIIDAYGKEITSEGCRIIDKEGSLRDAYVGRKVDYYLMNLSWLAYRVIFYTICANNVGGDLVLHPIRNAFQISYLNKDVRFNNTYRNIVSCMDRMTDQTIRKINSIAQPIVSNYILPLFSISIIDKVGSPSKIIDMALHMREEGMFIEARRKMEEIDLLYNNGENARYVSEINRLALELEQEMRLLGEKYYIETTQGVSVSPMIQVYNIGAAINGVPNIPNFSPKIKALNGIRSIIPKKGFNAIYKSIVNDLENISKIGEFHEKLTQNVVYEEYADYYTEKEELDKYRYSSSWWKIPMR